LNVRFVAGNFEHFNLIEAKVPILRFRDKRNKLEVDLNYNNCVGVRNTHLLHCYAQSKKFLRKIERMVVINCQCFSVDWRVRPLVLIIKLWAQHHQINNAKNSTISSYSLVLMVIHFLQCAVSPPVLPCLHTLYPDKFQVSKKL
jgi:poly(A) RNA polymerase GLD2